MRLNKFLFTAASVSLVVTSTALAAGGEHHVPEHVPNSVYFHVINLAIVIGLMVKFVRPMLRAYLVERHDTVKEALHSAEKARLEAEAAAAEYKNKLQELEAGMAAERERAKALALEESERLIANANAQADDIRNSTQKVIDDEVRNIRAGLQAQITEMALDIAIKMVRESVDSNDHSRIYSDYVSHVKTSEVN